MLGICNPLGPERKYTIEADRPAMPFRMVLRPFCFCPASMNRCEAEIVAGAIISALLAGEPFAVCEPVDVILFLGESADEPLISMHRAWGLCRDQKSRPISLQPTPCSVLVSK